MESYFLSGLVPTVLAVNGITLTSAKDTERLDALDWSLCAEPPGHPVHGLHSYPAKFVPALPRRLIEALTDPGDLIFDPFAGSGTALVEALLLGRRAIGGDLNPVAVAVARAKTTALSSAELGELLRTAETIPSQVDDLLTNEEKRPQLPYGWEPPPGSRFRGLKFWFDEGIALELSAIRAATQSASEPGCRAVLDMCFSSIIVAVSWQDSDTRYVRRRKSLRAGDATRLFVRRVKEAHTAIADFSTAVSSSAEVYEADARTMTYVEPGTVRLAITSPPYPNAWSYHLYHQNRILWLEGDPWSFKEREVGHHRTYSAAQGSDAADFGDDMLQALAGMATALSADGHVVVVVGDSIIRGEAVPNDEVVIRAASAAGLELRERYRREIDTRRKSFNPKIGKIRDEHVLVFAV